MAQFRSTLGLADPAGYARGIRLARDAVAYGRVRKPLILIPITAEACRFHPVEETVARALGATTGAALGLGEIDLLVRDWSKRSRAAAAAGAIDPAIGVPALE